ARRLNEAWGLPQLRQHAARALGGGRVREERLARKAGRQEIGVELRIALPGAHRLEFEHAPLQVRRQHLMLELFDGGQAVAIDFVEPPQIAGERVRLTIYRVPADV